MQENNEKVKFPVYYVSGKYIEPAHYEIVIIKKRLNENDPKTTRLRNQHGEFVEHTTTNENWIVFDKAPYFKEETFWVYGYDNKTDRKTCQWIVDNLILNSIESKYDVIRVLVYKNKLIIKYDNKPMSIIMCKNKSDCIRLYNFILEKMTNEKIKQVFCIGSYNIICDARREIEHDIMELTGWNKTKIQRSTN